MRTNRSFRDLIQAEVSKVVERITALAEEKAARLVREEVRRRKRRPVKRPGRQPKPNGVPALTLETPMAAFEHIKKNGPLSYQDAKAIPRATMKALLSMRAIEWYGTAKAPKLRVRK